MTQPYTTPAHAKTNLHLRLLGKRNDGYHEIDTKMVRISLADQLKLQWTDDDKITVTCSDPDIPTDEENLVVRAVRAMERAAHRTFSLHIDLKKEIPVGAGLGGGSSNAAAVIRAINEMANLNWSTEQMIPVAGEVGSDVPFFLHDRSCRCQGRGEIVTPLETQTPRLPVLLVKPNFPISAAWAYQNYAASQEHQNFSYIPQLCPWGEMVNDLERPVFEKFPLLGEMKNWLLGREEVLAALLSGSGSTMLAVLRSGGRKDALLQEITNRYGSTTWTFSGFTM